MVDLFRLLLLLLASFFLSPQPPSHNESVSPADDLTPFAQAVYAGTVFGEIVERRAKSVHERLYAHEQQPKPQPHSTRCRMGIGVP